MGLQIGDIVPRTAVEFSELKGKVIAVDAFNIIYQFLSTIRQADGTPLMDKNKKITSHLSGLFYRNVSLLQEGLKLVYVFDGTPPELKYKTAMLRKQVKDEARERYEKAVEEEDVESMGKYARQNVRITKEIIEESKELLTALGIPCIQAPGEGEAQASYIAKKHKAYAVGSQDYDSLLFQAPRLIQNLTLARKRKTVSGWIFISPEIIELEKVLSTLEINHEQLICLGILSGTDYNPGGIFRIGQKKALDLVKKHKTPAKIFEAVEEQMRNMPEEKQFDWKVIFELFQKPDVKDFDIEFPKLNPDKVRKILTSRDFSADRINSALDKLKDIKEERKQKKLF